MKYSAPLVLILLLASAAFALDKYPYYKILPANSSYAINEFEFENGTAQALIVPNQQIQAILLPVVRYSMVFTPLSEKERISSALYSYYLSLGYSPNATDGFAGVHAGIESIKNVRKAGENKCRLLLGTDRGNCTSFDSCQASCYSVTSFCMPMALGTGRQFVDVIWEFENNSRSLDKIYSQEEAAYGSFEQAKSPSTASSYLDSLSELNRAATRASGSPLYTDYSYCFSPQYNLSALTSLQLVAQNLFQNSSYFYNLPQETDLVYNRTQEGLARKAKYELPPPKSPAKKPGANSSQNLSGFLPMNVSQQEGQNATSPADSGQKVSPLIVQLAVVAVGFALFLACIFVVAAYFLFRKKKAPDAHKHANEQHKPAPQNSQKAEHPPHGEEHRK